MSGQNRFDLELVFLLFERASGVDEAAPTVEAGERIHNYAPLGGDQGVEVLRPEAPACIDPSPENAGIGARDVEEDGVEALTPFARGFAGPVEGGHGGDGDVLAVEVFGKAGQAPFVGICAEEFAFVVHGGCYEGGFSARCGTGIEDGFSRLGGEKFHRVTGGRILHVDEPAFGPRTGERTVESVVAGMGDCAEALAAFHVEGRWGGGICADQGWGRLVVPGKEGAGVLRAELLGPSFAEPLGMGKAESRGELFAFREERLARSDRSSQDGIDQSANGAAGTGYRFIHRRVIRNAEEEKLADPNPEDVACFVIEFPLAQHSDPVIQQAAIAQDGEEDTVEEGAISGGEAVAPGMPIDQSLGINVSLRPRAQG